MGNRLALTPTDGAGRADCEKSLVSGNLTNPAALPAGFRGGSRFTATAVAFGADLSFFNFDLCFRAECSIHKTEGQVIAQVSTTLCSRSGTSTAAAESEEILENITETRKNVFKSAKTGKPGSFKPCMTVLVVDSPFFGVVQNFFGNIAYMISPYFLAIMYLPRFGDVVTGEGVDLVRDLLDR